MQFYFHTPLRYYPSGYTPLKDITKHYTPSGDDTNSYTPSEGLSENDKDDCHGILTKYGKICLLPLSFFKAKACKTAVYSCM